ncbi:ubiquitin carboxyl-terminal hydrolase 2 [Trichomonascus vanleenenianus]|uniref:ubiquitin-specific protease UBP2 n=1 Tax=Trichomonascus vanleenenianus TaxID=2268995 RepID=UPI003ECACC8F
MDRQALFESVGTKSATKSWPRVLEDLVRTYFGANEATNLVPVVGPLYLQSSVSVRALDAVGALNPSQVPYTELSSTDASQQTYYFIMTESLNHLEVIVSSSQPNAMHEFVPVQAPPQAEPGIVAYHVLMSPKTDTVVRIIVRPPELTFAERAQFQEQSIHARYAKAKHLKPDAPVPTPAASFALVHRIANQILSSPERKEILANNWQIHMKIYPEFLEKRLFFLKRSDPEAQIEWYVPPDIYGDEDDPKAVYIRRKLYRLLLESAALGLRAQQNAERSGPNLFHCNFENAIPILKAALLSPDMSMNSHSTPHPHIPLEVYVAFAVLGACEYFSDAMVFAWYQKQIESDPGNMPHYVDALKTIAQYRGSEELQIAVMEQMSLGAISQSDVEEAYQKLGFSYEELPTLTGASIIERYQLKLIEQPDHAKSMLEALKTIQKTAPEDQVLQEFVEAEDMSVEEAHVYLQVTQNSDDDSINAIYELKCNELREAGNSLSKANTALLTIGKERRSAVLLNTYEVMTGKDALREPIESAYSLVGCERDTDVQNIIAIYNIRVQEDGHDILQLRQALRVIAQDKKSSLLANFVETGLATEPYPDQGLNWPVGVRNIGNTCYLNSLLQYYFTITPLREAVLSFATSGQKEDVNELEKLKIVKKVGGREVPKWEIIRAQEFITLLSEFFSELIHTREKYISPKRELAYLALVAPDAAVENERQIIKPAIAQASGETDEKQRNDHHKKDEQKNEEDAKEEMMIDLDDRENKENLSPESRKRNHTSDDDEDEENTENAGTDKRSSSTDRTLVFIEQPNEPKESEEESMSQVKREETLDNALKVGSQQDVTECIENVLFQLEAGFKAISVESDGEQNDIVKQLFYGKIKQVLENESDGGKRREKIERFNNILIDVAGGSRDIYDALDSYFGRDIVHTEGGVTKRTVTISELPPIIQVQVQRVQFDRVAERVFKSEATLRFDQTVYMDRYLDTDDETVITKRNQLWDWKDELRTLTEQLARVERKRDNGFTVKDTLRSTVDWLRKNSEDDQFKVAESTLTFIESEITKLGEKASVMTKRIDELAELIANQFTDMKQHGYRVHSVFIHRGQVSFGHYWVYINDVKNGVFRKYNDDYVTEVNYDDVITSTFKDETNSSTPYLLTFVREDISDQLVNGLVRDPTPLGDNSTSK